MGITGSAESVPKIHILYIIMQAFILALLPLVAFADHAPAYGYGPQYHCRDTNTSVYAEVCVPAFTTKVTPIELAVKEVVDNDYCYDQIVTVCTAADAIESYELCTYSYAPLMGDLTGTVTQVTYADKSETMKVTSCKPSGYGDHYGAGEHQYCREEYQTQAYKVPCVTKDITVTTVTCEDQVNNVCFNVAKFVDATNVIDQQEVILGEPNCNPVTLTLPTKACKKSHY